MLCLSVICEVHLIKDEVDIHDISLFVETSVFRQMWFNLLKVRTIKLVDFVMVLMCYLRVSLIVLTFSFWPSSVLSLVKFLSSSHPLGGHFRAALLRNGGLYGSVPVSAIAVCDSRLSNLCKLINPKVESRHLLPLIYIMRAATRLSEFVVISEGQLSIRRKDPYPSKIIESSIIQQSESPDSICIEAIHIPSSLEKAVLPVTLNVSSTGYYLDVIARKLDLTDGNKILVSR